MARKIKRFDAAKYLTTKDAESRTLSEAFASGHAGYIAAALGAVARADAIMKRCVE